MGRPKYPLEPLVELRDRQVDEAVKALAEKNRAKEAAARVRQSHERAAEEHQAEARRVRNDEGAALARGELRASDLMAQAAWSTRVSAEQADLDARARAAAEAEKARAKEAEEALAATGRAKADADVVEKDRRRFIEGHERRAEAREDEDALEVWNGRRRG